MPWRVDRDTCIGCSVCTDTAPGVFWLDENAGYARVKDEAAAAERRDCQDAERDCPVEAISFASADGAAPGGASGQRPSVDAPG